MAVVSRSSVRREPGLDLLRALLVIGMFAVHARRLQPAATRGAGAGDRIFDALMWAEPFIAAGFLFVVGTSLVLSRAAWSERPGGSWGRKLSTRAAGLYLLSVALFVPQYGVELPDLIVSPGILSVIALSIVAVGLALQARRARVALAVLAALGLLVTALCDFANVTLPGINAGPGGALPLVSFSAAGALLELHRQEHGPKALVAHCLAALPVMGAALWSAAPWTTLRASQYRVHAGLVALPELFAPAPRAAVQFWNHSAVGALGLMFPLTAVLLAFLALPKPLLAPRLLAPLGLLGRHALAAYVLHLGLLGVVELLGAGPRSTGGSWLLVAGLCVAAVCAGLVLDRRRAQSLPASGAAVAAQTRTS